MVLGLMVLILIVNRAANSNSIDSVYFAKLEFELELEKFETIHSISDSLIFCKLKLGLANFL